MPLPQLAAGLVADKQDRNGPLRGRWYLIRVGGGKVGAELLLVLKDRTVGWKK